MYTTEGGWLHIGTDALVEDALRARSAGFGGCKIKIGRPHLAEDRERLGAVRDAVGPGFEIMVDANQGFSLGEARRRAAVLEPLGIAWFEEPLPADDVLSHRELAASTSVPIAVGESLYSVSQFKDYLVSGAGVGRAGGRRPDRRHHPLAQGRAPGRGLQRGGVPALPDGAARGADVRRVGTRRGSSTSRSSTS